MRNLLNRFAPVLAALALVVTTASVNVACSWVCYQDEVPENAKKLRKF